MRKLIVANWKMNPEGGEEAARIFSATLRGIDKKSKVLTVVCPPALYLREISKMSLKRKNIFIGAQNCYFGACGSETGEIAAKMLKKAGAEFVILGHSERRAQGEGDELINKKIKSAFAAGMRVILCVGEKEKDEGGKYFDVIREMLSRGLDGVGRASVKNLIVAYEPVWAIGKNATRTATPEESTEIALFIRKVLADRFGRKAAFATPILYGGSVSIENAGDFLSRGGVDGLLVGRASLDPEEFAEIVRKAEYRI